MAEASARLVELVAEGSRASQAAPRRGSCRRGAGGRETGGTVGPVARGELFHYGVVSVFPSEPNWWN